MFKIIKVVVAVVVLVLLLAAGVAAFAIYRANDLAKAAIERGGTYAMGVPTKVDSVSIGFLKGTFAMKGLNIANPAGYTSPAFLSLGSGSVSVNPSSLGQPVITLPSLALSDLNLSIERRGSVGNYQVILDNVKKVTDEIAKTTGGGSGGTSTAGGGEVKVIVNELLIRKVNVHVDLLGAEGAVGQALSQATQVNVPIDEIKLNDVGKTGTGVAGTGVTLSQLASIVVQAVLGAAADKGGGLLPADLLGDLNGRLGALGGLKGIPMQVLGNPAAAVDQIGKKIGGDVGKTVEGAAKGAIDQVGKGLQGLIPGAKKDEKKPGG